MTIILQVREPISRLEMVSSVHDALSSVENSRFKLCSDPRDVSLADEKPGWLFPNVAGFSWDGNANPVAYTRNLGQYWDGVLEGGATDQTVRNVRFLLGALQEIGMRADSGLTFIAGMVPFSTMSDHPRDSPEIDVLKTVAQYLVKHSASIQRTAVMFRYTGAAGRSHSSVYGLDEVR